MAKYRITGPDGKSYEITAPDDASEQDVLAYAQQNYQQAKTPAAQPAQPETFDPTEGMSWFDKAAAGLGKSMVDTAEGIGQLTGFVDQAQVDERRQLDQALMNTGAGMAGNVVGQLGQMMVPVSGGAKVASLLGRATPYAGAAARSAGFAATQPVATGETRLGNAGEAAGWGLAGAGLAQGATRLAKGASDKLAPEVLKLYQRAQQAGIPIHFSQLSDSKFVKTLASTLGYLPFSGSGKAAAAQQEGFNRAVSRSFGEDAASLTDDVVANARKRIGSEFDRIYSANAVTLDNAALTKLGQIEQQAARNLPPNEAQIVKNQIDDLLQMSQNGAMPGQAYQAFRTDRLLPMEGGQRSFLTNSIRDIRKTLDDAANRSVGPQDAKSLAKARGQYRNLKTTDKALKQVSGADGNVRPASLWPIVNGPKGASNEMRELARIGQLIKDPIPDSGTAGRLLTSGIGAGAAGVGGMAALGPLAQMVVLGATAGRIGNSQLAARYMAQGGGKPLHGLARLVQPAPRALPAAAAPAGMEVPITGGRVATPEEIAADEELVRQWRARRGR
jgi:hypothetical protein